MGEAADFYITLVTPEQLAASQGATPHRRCHSCQTRDWSCHGSFPCHHCRRLGLECLVPAAKRRGPKPGKRGELQTTVAALEVTAREQMQAIAARQVCAPLASASGMRSFDCRQTLTTFLDTYRTFEVKTGVLPVCVALHLLYHAPLNLACQMIVLPTVDFCIENLGTVPSLATHVSLTRFFIALSLS